jgi:hypothetical protein
MCYVSAGLYIPVLRSVCATRSAPHAEINADIWGLPFPLQRKLMLIVVRAKIIIIQASSLTLA